MNEEIKDIAQGVLGINTLETRKSDSLDFYDLPVWQIKLALEKAYKIGFKKASMAK